jgi:hypothetical protein
VLEHSSIYRENVSLALSLRLRSTVAPDSVIFVDRPAVATVCEVEYGRAAKQALYITYSNEIWAKYIQSGQSALRFRTRPGQGSLPAARGWAGTLRHAAGSYRVQAVPTNMVCLLQCGTSLSRSRWKCSQPDAVHQENPRSS